MTHTETSFATVSRRAHALETSDRPRVFLVDGHFEQSSLLSRFFEGHGLDVEVYRSGDHFLATDQADRRGCVLFGAAKAASADLSLLARLKSEAHRLAAIVVADRANTRLVVDAMKLGAFDVVEQPFDHNQLLSIVQEALSVIQRLDPLVRAVAAPATGETALAAWSTLTDRQGEILTRIVKGQPNKIIAADLGISQRTAENHRAAIMRKMGASSISSLIQMAIAAVNHPHDDSGSVDDDVAAVALIDVIPRILEVACRFTGMRFAAVARVTEDRWVACAVRDEIEFGLAPGGELRVSSTICSEIRDHNRPVVIEHVAIDDLFRDHPTPRQYGFQSYISVPIRHRGRFFGTLCALDPQPAALKSPSALLLFELLADLVGSHLDAHARLVRVATEVTSGGEAFELHRQFSAFDDDLRDSMAAIDLGAGLLLRASLMATMMEKCPGLPLHSD